ncbi:hypothetical protein OIU84_025872, partial [Salix udensis]
MVIDVNCGNRSGKFYRVRTIYGIILELSKLVSIDLRWNSLNLQKPGLQHLVEALTNLEVLHLSGVDISAKGLWIAGRVPPGNIPVTQPSLSQYPEQISPVIGNLKSLKEFH